MSITEAYLLLLVDSFVSNLVFCTSDEVIFNTMKVFGIYNNYIILAVATGAYFLSITVNYLFGVLCYNIFSTKISDKTGGERINLVKESKYLPLIILLSFINFYGKFIILFMGFCRVNIYLVIVLALTSKILFYSYLLWF